MEIINIKNFRLYISPGSVSYMIAIDGYFTLKELNKIAEYLENNCYTVDLKSCNLSYSQLRVLLKESPSADKIELQKLLNDYEM